MILNVRANGQATTATVSTPPTVSSFLASHGPAYGTNANTAVKVNGREADGTQILRDGDVVEFTQRTSSKAAAFTVSVTANGSTRNHTLDAALSANQLIRDASFAAAYGLNGNTQATVNGGSKSSDSALTGGDRVAFTQRTSSKA